MLELEKDRAEIIAVVRKQEALAQFTAFNEETAFDLGSAIYTIARSKRLPVAINIRTSERVLFHAAMPGATPDNDQWVRRKSNVVLRFHQSSLLYGQSMAEKGRTIGPEWGLDPLDYAGHGGSFPIRVKKVGVIGAITVSGLPQLDDHRMIIEALDQFLKLELPKF
ncbi:heme-degrading domain-containing protein [Rhizobium sp. TH2]|uniref:heme-degrading domain-containing protein n=1 Tax=Rhizobium sp. TH2 TaxID=2775403 RepID=UPI00215855E0|nr:heme-degrading domain-containing protein [Rhizobium sp. TH2]UVC09572.1 heme-degrading domain-containing protein [Rhizobium sp. TH2]